MNIRRWRWRWIAAIGAGLVVVGASITAPIAAHDADCTRALLGAEIEAIEPPEEWVLQDMRATPGGWSLDFQGPVVRRENEYTGYDASFAEALVVLSCVEDGDALFDARTRGDAWRHKRLVDVAAIGDRTHATEAVAAKYRTVTELELHWLSGNVAGTLWMHERIEDDVSVPWPDLEGLALAVDAVLP